MKCLNNMDRLIFQTDMLLDMMNLYKFSGKDFYYDYLFDRDVLALKRVNVISETIGLCKILDLDLTENRLNLLASNDLVPKNSTEKLVLNIKETLKSVIANVSNFETDWAEIEAVAINLFNDIYKVRFKETKIEGLNKFTAEKSKHSKATDLDELIRKYKSMQKSKDYEITTLITNFFFDFYMLKPFEEMGDSRINYIMSLMIFYIFLYKYEFNVFSYESFFARLYENMKSFHEAIDAAEYKYEAGLSQTTAIHRIIIKIILECYDSLENKASYHEAGKQIKQSKENEVEVYIYKMPVDKFRKTDLKKQFPHISEKTIERVLEKLSKEKIISVQGTGRSAFWIKNTSLQNGFEYEISQFDFGDIDKE